MAYVRMGTCLECARTVQRPVDGVAWPVPTPDCDGLCVWVECLMWAEEPDRGSSGDRVRRVVRAA